MEVTFVSARHWEVSSSGCPVIEMHKLIHVGFLSHHNTDRPDFRPESQRHLEVEMLIPAMWNWICTPRQTCTPRSLSSEANQLTEVCIGQKLSTVLLRATLLLKQSSPSVIRERTAEGTESVKNLVVWILVRAGDLLMGKKALQPCSIYGRNPATDPQEDSSLAPRTPAGLILGPGTMCTKQAPEKCHPKFNL